jgi:hypothetical protein
MCAVERRCAAQMQTKAAILVPICVTKASLGRQKARYASTKRPLRAPRAGQNACKGRLLAAQSKLDFLKHFEV